MIGICLAFSEKTVLFFSKVIIIYIAIRSVWEFYFLYIFTSALYAHSYSFSAVRKLCSGIYLVLTHISLINDV